MRTLLQRAGQQQLPEPTQQPTPTPITTPSIQLEALVAPTGTLDSTLQEPIPESLNMEDIASMEQWAAGCLQNMATPTTGSAGAL